MAAHLFAEGVSAMIHALMYNFTGRVPGSDWLKMRYRSYLPPEHAYHCLNKSLAINTHYDDVIMVCFN